MNGALFLLGDFRSEGLDTLGLGFDLGGLLHQETEDAFDWALDLDLRDELQAPP